ncbi:DUF1624 domain-containing protein [Cellulomonas sp. H30R-01]|uniref:heparan-alpha-glucosaminide N-acetyltransferase domain-containing protein n=1 Tax=Cellulomonas sp. H30R-01 TaxID=2704467 RepID=UPI00138B6349|nr:heparan-alpha-glucosaminide N-acetyltransferase domain-containing protein [Cellulomonas sp. H30R-01]QHT55082.1 DUF1624 domain-containing protein [Cellulomonas sp. H30R-01]
MRRIAGVDVARGLAVLGMMTAHVGPDDPGSRVVPGGFAQLADGRPSALFVVLAGIGLALLSGGASPVAGTRLVQARLRVLVRAVLLFALGELLVMLGTPVAVILPTYAVLFAVGCLALRWSVRTLLVVAAAVAVVGPVVRTLLEAGQQAWQPRPTLLAEIAVGHFYPAVVWLAYLLAGLAVGRCDLRSARVRLVAAATGAGLVVLGHGGAWVARDVLGWPATVATTEPHSSTTFEVLGNTGVALLVLVACLVVAEAAPHVVSPLAAVGELALSAYTVHVVVIALLGDGVVYTPAVASWLAFLVTTTVLCWSWRATLGRGPFERVLHGVSTRAADVRPDTLPDAPAASAAGVPVGSPSGQERP